MSRQKSYQNIDLFMTGKLLRRRMEYAGCSVRDIQEYLQLSCPQPIYRWFQGRILPSVDHLYMLSRLFQVHMEDLLIPDARYPELTAFYEPSARTLCLF